MGPPTSELLKKFYHRTLETLPRHQCSCTESLRTPSLNSPYVYRQKFIWFTSFMRYFSLVFLLAVSSLSSSFWLNIRSPFFFFLNYRFDDKKTFPVRWVTVIWCVASTIPSSVLEYHIRDGLFVQWDFVILHVIGVDEFIGRWPD